MTPPPPTSTLFPYMTLFRSPHHRSPPVHAAQALGALPGRLVGRSQSAPGQRSEEHTSELQSRRDPVCRLLLEKKNKTQTSYFASTTRPSPSRTLTSASWLPRGRKRCCTGETIPAQSHRPIERIIPF